MPSEWDDEFIDAVTEIAVPVIGVPPENDGEDVNWDMLDEFTRTFYMNFCYELLREVDDRVRLMIFEWNEDHPDEGEDWLPPDVVERAIAIAHDLYMPARAGLNALRDYMIIGIKAMWDIDDDEVKSAA